MNPSVHSDLPSQSNHDAANLYASSPSYRIHFPITGVVVGMHWPSDPPPKGARTNYREITYDILPEIPDFGLLTRVPLAYGLNGISDQEEIVLKPAAVLMNPSSPSTSASTANGVPVAVRGRESDGDRVMVQFLNGCATTPIITAILNQPYKGAKPTAPQYSLPISTEILSPGPSTPTPDPGYVFGTGSPGSTAAVLKATPGPRHKHTSINGTHVAIDQNGDVFINFKPHPDQTVGIVAGAVTKKIVIQNEGTDYLRLEKTPAGKILVTFGNGAQHAILGDLLKTLFDAHTHSTGTGPSGPPLAPNNFASVAGGASDPLSQKMLLPGV